MALEFIDILSKAVPPALPGIGSRPRSATGGSTSGYAMNGMDGNESARTADPTIRNSVSWVNSNWHGFIDWING